MLSRRKQYGAALLSLLDEEGQQSADNLGKKQSTVLPEGARWIPHKSPEPDGKKATGSKTGCDSQGSVE